MAKNLTPAEIAQKQVDRLGQSRDAIQRGIEGVTESPTAKAAASLDKAKANYVAAIESGKTGDALKRVSLDEWKSKTIAKVDRVAEGARASQSTIEEFHSQRASHQSKIDQELSKIPKRTPADSERRMITQMKGMMTFGFKKRAG